MKEMCCPICEAVTAHPADAKVVKCANCLRSFQLEPKSMNTKSQQQIAREAWSQLDRATLTHHNLDGGKSEQGIAIILSAIEQGCNGEHDAEVRKAYIEKLTAILKDRSKGEVETWGFVSMFIDMMKEANEVEIKESE